LNNTKLPKCNLLAHEVQIQLNMLYTPMMNWIFREIHR